MAWFAQIDIAAGWVGDHVTQPVSYYDDAVLDKNGKPTLVYATTLTFPLGSKIADLQSAVVATGQSARKASQVAAQLASQAPVGTTVAIP